MGFRSSKLFVQCNMSSGRGDVFLLLTYVNKTLGWYGEVNSVTLHNVVYLMYQGVSRDLVV